MTLREYVYVFRHTCSCTCVTNLYCHGVMIHCLALKLYLLKYVMLILLWKHSITCRNLGITLEIGVLLLFKVWPLKCADFQNYYGTICWPIHRLAMSVCSPGYFLQNKLPVQGEAQAESWGERAILLWAYIWENFFTRRYYYKGNSLNQYRFIA